VVTAALKIIGLNYRRNWCKYVTGMLVWKSISKRTCNVVRKLSDTV
jgi:hypothetical protein